MAAQAIHSPTYVLAGLLVLLFFLFLLVMQERHAAMRLERIAGELTLIKLQALQQEKARISMEEMMRYESLHGIDNLNRATREHAATLQKLSLSSPISCCVHSMQTLWNLWKPTEEQESP